MPRNGNAREKIRLSLDVTPEMKDLLDRLADRAGSTQADVLRRAIGLYATVKEGEANEEGSPALVKDGKVVVRLVGA
jgi:hypothetical protein